MDAPELRKCLEQKELTKEKQIIETTENNYKEVYKELTKIKTWMPRIEKLLDMANVLRDFKIPLGKNIEFIKKLLPWLNICSTYEFKCNGLYGIGFYKSIEHDTICSETEYTLFTVECNNTVSIYFKREKLRLKIDEPVSEEEKKIMLYLFNQKDVQKAIKKFTNKFEKFEKRFHKYIDNVCKKNNFNLEEQ